MTNLTARLASEDDEYDIAESLFRQYAAELDFDLEFQHFEEELEEIKSQYSYPEGGIILLYAGEKAVGCVGIRQFSQDEAELKRMYIKPAWRAKGGGRILMVRAIDLAKSLGYGAIKLDPIDSMKSAITIYAKYGFKECEPYRYNPFPGGRFYELKLD